jgi:hypothetical protein
MSTVEFLMMLIIITVMLIVVVIALLYLDKIMGGIERKRLPLANSYCSKSFQCSDVWNCDDECNECWYKSEVKNCERN